jgi:hypothetical protein
MKTFETLKQSLETKLEPVIVSSREFVYKGESRKSLHVRKAKGRRTYMVVQYGNGRFSSAV